MSKSLLSYLKNAHAIAASMVAIFLLVPISIGVVTAIQVYIVYQKTVNIQNDLDTSVLQALQSLDATRINLGVDDSAFNTIQHATLLNNAQLTLYKAFMTLCARRDDALTTCPNLTDGSIVLNNNKPAPTKHSLDPTQNKAIMRAWYGCQQGTSVPKYQPLQNDNSAQAAQVYCAEQPEFGANYDEVLHVQLQVPVPSAKWLSGGTVLKVFHAEARILRKSLDLNILLDNSLSMGFSATLNKGNVPVDRLGLLWDNTGVCFFACHEVVGMPILKADETYPHFNVALADQKHFAEYDPTNFTTKTDLNNGDRLENSTTPTLLPPERAPPGASIAVPGGGSSCGIKGRAC